MTSHETIWLAGLLEGEGSFTVVQSRGKPRARVSVFMTDRDVVERVAALFEMPVHRRPARQSNWKEQFNVNVTGPKALRIMRAVLPHMGTRRTARINELLELTA